MPLIGFMVASALAAGVVPSSPSQGVLKAAYQNTPGLTCHAIVLAGVYNEPSKGSKYLGVTHNFIATTGPQVNKFYPIVTGRGIRGWVAADEILNASGPMGRGECWVQQAHDGRLLFGWSQPGQG